MSSLEALMWPSSTAGSNPYVDQLAAAVEAAGARVVPFSRRAVASGRFDVCHVHWPEWAFAGASGPRGWARTATLLGALAAGRARGTAVCWTVHNALPHDERSSRLERTFWPAFTRLVSGTIRLSAASGQEIDRLHPALAGKPHRVIPHGPYDAVHPAPPAPDAARSAWGVPSGAPTVAFFGQLRRYKGVDALLDAFGGLEDPAARLLVAGAPVDADVGRSVAERAGTDPRIGTRLRRLDAEEVSELAGATDLFVLPYRRVLNSGAALLALSVRTPVLVPSTPTFDELAGAVGEEWVIRYEGGLTPAVLHDALAAALQLRGGAPDLSKLAWEDIGRATVGFYAELRGRGGRA